MLNPNSKLKPRLLRGFSWWSALLFLLLPRAARGEHLTIEQVFTDTTHVTDIAVSPTEIFVASLGGVQQYDSTTLELVRHYTQLDGLDSPSVLSLSRERGKALVARTEHKQCVLRGQRFQCKNAPRLAAAPPRLGDFYRGRRVTALLSTRSPSPQGKDHRLLGTAGAGAFFDEVPLNRELSGPRHVTALSTFLDELYIGTFNGGLLRQTARGNFLRIESAPTMINALVRGRQHLFVGASSGLFRTSDGTNFEPLTWVEGAVVGLAFDGTSIWVSTSGALYRIRDGAGPPSEVWWTPGASKSLQKVSVAGQRLWLGTEDRGAISMDLFPHLTARHRPFEVYDLTRGFPSSWSLAVAARPSGGALITSLNKGLVRADPAGQARTVASPSIGAWGLSTLGSARGVWVGTQQGAAYFPDEGEDAIPLKGLPHPCVHAFFEDDRPGWEGRLWVGTENGLGLTSVGHLDTIRGG